MKQLRRQEIIFNDFPSNCINGKPLNNRPLQVCTEIDINDFSTIHNKSKPM